MVERAPRAADGWYNLGAIALELGQYRNAGYAARQALAIEPDDGGAVRRSAPALPTRGPRCRTCRKRRRSSAASARAPLPMQGGSRLRRLR
jgi:hypothetical protein